MSSVLFSLLHSLQFTFRSRSSLHLEIIALRHQLAVVHRSRRPRLALTSTDRVLWAWLSQAWSGWGSAVVIVKPETVIAWHRRGFRVVCENSAQGLRGCTVVELEHSAQPVLFQRSADVVCTSHDIAPARD